MFFKVFWYDFQNGFLKGYKKHLSVAVLIIIICLDFNLRRTAIMQGFQVTTSTYGDFLFYMFGGMEEYIVNPGNPFKFPELWMLIMLLGAYRVLYYPFNDLMGFGKQVLLNSKSRRRWWLAKCCWAIVSMILYFLLILGVTFVFCLIAKVPITLNISDYLLLYYGASPDSINALNNLSLPLLLLPVLTMVSLVLLQLLLGLIVKPLYSFIVTISIMIVSCYYVSPFLPGNYAMVRRSSMLMENGVDAWMGITIAFVISAASIMIGLVLFKHYDILNKE